MLRHNIDDDLFFHILKTYYVEFNFKTLTTEQFRDFYEWLFGIELASFFEQWMYNEGVPSYEFTWRSEVTAKNDEWRVNVPICQVHDLYAVFTMPIDIVVVTSNETKTKVMHNDQRMQAVEFYSRTKLPQSL